MPKPAWQGGPRHTQTADRSHAFFAHRDCCATDRMAAAGSEKAMRRTSAGVSCFHVPSPQTFGASFWMMSSSLAAWTLLTNCRCASSAWACKVPRLRCPWRSARRETAKRRIQDNAGLEVAASSAMAKRTSGSMVWGAGRAPCEPTGVGGHAQTITNKSSHR